MHSPSPRVCAFPRQRPQFAARRLRLERQLVDVLADQLGFPSVEPSFSDLERDLLGMVKPDWCRRHQAIPLRKAQQGVEVAFCNPLDRYARQAAEGAFGSVQPAITTTRALENAVKAFEVLNETVKEAILAKRTSSEIRRISVETSGLITLLEDGIAKAAQGYTTLQEILRNLPRFGKPRPLPELLRLVGEVRGL
jgi:type II secretory ATPase GspE/PulE/Tfp pilus assembly ATPase PilB-like protein